MAFGVLDFIDADGVDLTERAAQKRGFGRSAGPEYETITGQVDLSPVCGGTCEAAVSKFRNLARENRARGKKLAGQMFVRSL